VTGAAFQGVAAAVATACGVPEPRRPDGPEDWLEFGRLVDRHHVAPLVHRSEWLPRAGAPPEVRAQGAERARSDALRSLRLVALQREVLGVLAAAGADAVVLKGAVLASDAYGDPTARAPRDLDVLVAPEAVGRAVHALRSAGLDWVGWGTLDDTGPAAEPETFERLRHHRMLAHVSLARAGLVVELHWRLFANTRLMPVDPGWLTNPRLVEVYGDAVPALPLNAQWL